MIGKAKLPPLKWLKKPKRSPMERRLCPDTKRVQHGDTFTHGLVRASAKIWKAKRDAKRETKRLRGVA